MKQTTKAADALAVLRAISADLVTGAAIEDASARVLARLVQDLPATSGAVYAGIAGDTSRLRSVAQLGDGAAHLEAHAHRVVEPTPAVGQRADDNGVSLLALPLCFEGRSVGAIVLGRREPFGEREHEIVEVVAAQLVLAIERHQAGELLDRRLAEVTIREVQVEAHAAGIEAERTRADRLAGQLRDLNQNYLATVRGLAIAIETKDENTPGHLERVTRYGLGMLRMLAPDASRSSQYEYGFLLHDIGMLAVPDEVLKKPGELSELEWELLRGHPAVGYRMLDGIPYLSSAKEIVLAHHERWDGKGYPLGLEGADIPLGARVFPLADAFEAMTSNRPYRQAMSVADALAELRRGSGRQFWPDAVEAFCAISAVELDEIRLFTREQILAAPMDAAATDA